MIMPTRSLNYDSVSVSAGGDDAGVKAGATDARAGAQAEQQPEALQQAAQNGGKDTSKRSGRAKVIVSEDGLKECAKCHERLPSSAYNADQCTVDAKIAIKKNGSGLPSAEYSVVKVG
jgi:hypothetical protein